MENKEINLTNKVVLDVNTYVERENAITELRHECNENLKKYNNLLKYLFSECQLKKYTSGKEYLEYDTYNNHLTDYLREIEPKMYQEQIEKKREEQE